MYSFSCAIFQRALQTIEEHKNENKNTSKHSQAMDWWESLPDYVQSSLREHSHLVYVKNITDFYWSDES